MTPEQKLQKGNIFERLARRRKVKLTKQALTACGSRVSIPCDLKFWGYNVRIGNNVSLSPGGGGYVQKCARNSGR